MDLGVILPPERIAAMEARGDWAGKTTLDYLDATLARDPARTAVIAHDSETGSTTTLTYAELDRAARRIAHGLVALGIAPGDVVSFQLPNWWQFTALHLACIHAGAISNPLMPIFRARELRFMLGFAEAKLYVGPARFRGFDYPALMRDIAPELPQLKNCFYIGGGGAQSFERHFLDTPRADAPDILAARRSGANDVTQLLYTSGTTGQPKGVMHTANTMFACLTPIVQRFAMGAEDVIWMASPLAHQTGFMYGMMLPVMLGAPSVLHDIWAPAEAACSMARTGATFTMASTPFLADLADLPSLAEHDLSRFRIFLSAGAPIPRSLVERATARLGAHVLSGWGMTEIGCVTCCAPGDAAEKIFGTDGVALPGSAVKVVNEDGTEAPAGVEGLLKCRPNSLFAGYLKRPEAFGVDGDGWLDTGDYARMDADGYIRITGRAKDIIIRGGENIPVVEVEELLYRHPAVRECAVVAMPDARLGERGCAFVGLADGAALSFQEMAAHLRGHGMAVHYFPEKLVIRDALPRTPSGKIQKFVLREEAKAFTVDR
ncbi:MAG: AMP-binding protein [Alphaproteobacteria bacterium]|nr:AMP-binding protein [Alphaproteobacteria bacterium]